MNWHYVVIIIAVFVMFISMGSNPFEAPEGYVPPDEFNDGIKAKLSESNGFGGGDGSPFSAGGGFAPGGNTGGGGGAFSSGGSFNNNPTPGQSIIRRNNYDVSGGQNYGQQEIPTFNSQQSDIDVPPQLRRDSLGAPPPQQNPSRAVPAPFRNLPQSKLQTPSPSRYHFPGFPDIHTTKGKPLKFVGSSVYTATSDGRQVVLADGVHYLNDGRKITVKDGKSIMPRSSTRLSSTQRSDPWRNGS